MAGPLVFGILLYAIHRQIQQQSGWKQSLDALAGALSGRSLMEIAVAFLLMFVNWGTEAFKWKLALSYEQAIPFRRALKAVFAGTTVAFFTPNRIGEYMGRILYVEKGHRVSSIASSVVCSMAQLMITLATGICGLIYLITRQGLITGEKSFWLGVAMYPVATVLIILTIFYFRLNWLIKWLEKIPGTRKYLTYISITGRFNATRLLQILSLSAVRYLVFIVQYYLFFSVFNVGAGWWQTFWSVSVVFLVIAVVPDITVLSDLGVRWGASLEVVRLFSKNMAGILATSLSVWIINLVVPALVGSLLIAGLKIFGKAEQQIEMNT